MRLPGPIGVLQATKLFAAPVLPLAELHAAGTTEGHRFEASARLICPPHDRFQRTWGPLAVHRITGDIRILHSVHAADIGRLINPMQCRGQIDGAIGWASAGR